MKIFKLSILSLIALAFALGSAVAQDYKAQFPVKVDDSGMIKDKSGVTYGTISADSVIKNHQGRKVAFIDNQGNLVDKEGKILGKAAKNGDFVNINGEVEYVVKPAGDLCEVYDKSGKQVATVHKNYKTQAGCVAHCMHAKVLQK
jgi:hypothetical protein